MDWFRMWHGMPNDDKLRVVARRSKQTMAVVVAVWVYLLDYASAREERGSVEGVDAEAVAVCLDIDVESVEAIFLSLREKERIENNKIASWDRLQPKREDSSSERVRKHRNAMKRNVTQCNAPDTDTDTEEEVDKEKTKTKSSMPSDFSDICNTTRKAICKITLSSTDLEVIKSWPDIFTPEEIETACRLTRERGGKSVGYIDAILRSEKDKGNVGTYDLSEVFIDEVAP